MKETKGLGKNIGVGGIKCDCCRFGRSVKECRININRTVRRRAKIAIRKEKEEQE